MRWAAVMALAWTRLTQPATPFVPAPEDRALRTVTPEQAAVPSPLVLPEVSPDDLEQCMGYLFTASTIFDLTTHEEAPWGSELDDRILSFRQDLNTYLTTDLEEDAFADGVVDDLFAAAGAEGWPWDADVLSAEDALVGAELNLADSFFRGSFFSPPEHDPIPLLDVALQAEDEATYTRALLTAGFALFGSYPEEVPDLAMDWLDGDPVSTAALYVRALEVDPTRADGVASMIASFDSDDHFYEEMVDALWEHRRDLSPGAIAQMAINTPDARWTFWLAENYDSPCARAWAWHALEELAAANEEQGQNAQP